MAVDIDTVTIGGIEDRRLCLGNATAARKLSVGSSWNRLRFGVRVSFDDTGANITGTPRLWIGLLNNPSASAANGPLGTTSHFLGIRTRAATWTRAAGPPVYYSLSAAAWESVKRVSTTDTTAAGSGTCLMIAAPSTNRWPIMVEIIKGSPNYTVRGCFWNSTISNVDFTLEQFQRTMEGNSLEQARDLAAQVAGAAKFLVQLDGSIAVNEGVDGALNSICVAWNQSGSILRISDARIYILEAA